MTGMKKSFAYDQLVNALRRNELCHICKHRKGNYDADCLPADSRPGCDFHWVREDEIC